MDTKYSIELALQPMFEKAEKEHLWFWSERRGMWFSPQELRKEHSNGKYLWGPENWELKDPNVELNLMQTRIDNTLVNMREFKKRMSISVSFQDDITFSTQINYSTIIGAASTYLMKEFIENRNITGITDIADEVNNIMESIPKSARSNYETHETVAAAQFYDQYCKINKFKIGHKFDIPCSLMEKESKTDEN